jgi:DNA-binding NtrC family response regulator
MSRSITMIRIVLFMEQFLILALATSSFVQSFCGLLRKDWGKIRILCGVFLGKMTGKPLRILVVDDEALIRWSLTEILGCEGHKVVQAVSASTAREVMDDASQPIDVVLLDYRLPDSNDLKLLEEVRQRRPGSAVVLMTAYGGPDVVKGALDRGAYCVVDKPFDMRDVEPLVRSAHQAMRPH